MYINSVNSMYNSGAFKMTYEKATKHLRATVNTWQKIKTASDNENIFIKDVLDQILTGTRDPMTLELVR